jgi:hypothetical protein
MDIITPQYIYLLHTREFINCKMHVYKIGRTKQANLERFLTYPKGSVILLHTICHNCCSCGKENCRSRGCRGLNTYEYIYQSKYLGKIGNLRFPYDPSLNNEGLLNIMFNLAM